MHAQNQNQRIKPASENRPRPLKSDIFCAEWRSDYFFFFTRTHFTTDMVKQNHVSVLTVRRNWISSSPSPPSAMAVVAEPGAVDWEKHRWQRDMCAQLHSEPYRAEQAVPPQTGTHTVHWWHTKAPVCLVLAIPCHCHSHNPAHLLTGWIRIQKGVCHLGYIIIKHKMLKHSVSFIFLHPGGQHLTLNQKKLHFNTYVTMLFLTFHTYIWQCSDLFISYVTIHTS